MCMHTYTYIWSKLYCVCLRIYTAWADLIIRTSVTSLVTSFYEQTKRAKDAKIPQPNLLVGECLWLKKWLMKNMSEQRRLLQLYILSSHLAAEAAGRAQQKALIRLPDLQDGGYCGWKQVLAICIIHCDVQASVSGGVPSCHQQKVLAMLPKQERTEPMQGAEVETEGLRLSTSAAVPPGTMLNHVWSKLSTPSSKEMLQRKGNHDIPSSKPAAVKAVLRLLRAEFPSAKWAALGNNCKVTPSMAPTYAGLVFAFLTGAITVFIMCESKPRSWLPNWLAVYVENAGAIRTMAVHRSFVCQIENRVGMPSLQSFLVPMPEHAGQC